MAHEMFLKKDTRIGFTNDQDGLKCDIFSLGIILWQMLMDIDDYMRLCCVIVIFQ